MIVEELLEKKNIYYLQKGKDYLIRCLNPEHEDKNPSMRVDQLTGIFNCFSCGFKGNLFTFYGEKANQLQLRRELLKRKIIDKAAETVGLSFPTQSVPYTGNWRDISPKTYKAFEAFQCHENEFVGRIVFPIRDVKARIRAFCGRHTTGGIPKYYFSPKKAKIPLFPTVEPIAGKVILVEGIFDVLNLYDKGITNAVCMFGTSNINSDKLSLLKMQGVDEVVILLDSDEAGAKATDNVQEFCNEIDLGSSTVRLKNGDPGDLTKAQVVKLKERLEI